MSSPTRQPELSSPATSTKDAAKRPLFISVIVPVRNEAKCIADTLGQLVTQDYDPQRYEILVVDGQSTDETVDLAHEFVERYDNVQVLSNPHRLSSAARNIGIRHARGDVVVIVDGHCELEDDQYLAKLASAFESSGADCLGRPQPLDISDATPLQRAIAAARSSRLGHHPESHIYSLTPQFVPAKSVAVAYRRGVFEQIGYFDETFDAHEDGEFNYRVDQAGLRCWLTPELTLKYQPRASLPGLFRQMVRYGRGRIRLMRKHGGDLSSATLFPAVFVVGLIGGLPLGFLSSTLAMIYVAAILLYLLVVLSVSFFVVLKKRTPRFLHWIPLALAVIHVGAGTGLLIELIAGKRSIDSART